jgi:hypothetical protein
VIEAVVGSSRSADRRDQEVVELRGSAIRISSPCS